MKQNSDKRKLVLVGTGFVGMSFAYTLLTTPLVDELVLIDIDYEKTVGEEMDLS
ncbi:MAG: L-lactate dehydrogenase, partial [Erysipelotrichaceae bacterium]|nr:L-lactate dehydrogenase [Erysipelotrichaceae bacterium]